MKPPKENSPLPLSAKGIVGNNFYIDDAFSGLGFLHQSKTQ